MTKIQKPKSHLSMTRAPKTQAKKASTLKQDISPVSGEREKQLDGDLEIGIEDSRMLMICMAAGMMKPFRSRDKFNHEHEPGMDYFLRLLFGAALEDSVRRSRRFQHHNPISQRGAQQLVRICDEIIEALGEHRRGEKTEKFDYYFPRGKSPQGGKAPMKEKRLRSIVYWACEHMVNESPRGKASAIWKKGADAMQSAGYTRWNDIRNGYGRDDLYTEFLSRRDKLNAPAPKEIALALDLAREGIEFPIWRSE